MMRLESTPPLIWWGRLDRTSVSLPFPILPWRASWAASRLTLAAQESKPSGVACLQLEESPAMLQVDGVGPAATGEFVRIRVDHLATIPSVDQP